MTDIKLTDYAHGGGCGCKIAPQLLTEILKSMPRAGPWTNLLVGTETSDDAAVYKLNDEQALIATTDFFMTISRTQMKSIHHQNAGREERPEKFVMFANPDEIASPKPTATPCLRRP